MEYWLFLLIMGFFLGAFGTLVGTGGGFILVPILLWLYPQESPVFITSISLAVVTVNSLSGVAAYGRMRRIDIRSGIIFAVATIPGAMLGAYCTSYVPRDMFNVSIGTLFVISSLILWHKPGSKKQRAGLAVAAPSGSGQATAVQTAPNRLMTGAALSFLFSFFASLLGISGGIFQVPMMVYGLGFPVHIAVATSEFVLTIKGLAATSVHLFTGALFAGIQQIIVLSVGVAFGAQGGAWLSSYVHGGWIIRALAISVGLIGGEFLVRGLAL